MLLDRPPLINPCKKAKAGKISPLLTKLSTLLALAAILFVDSSMPKAMSLCTYQLANMVLVLYLKHYLLFARQAVDNFVHSTNGHARDRVFSQFEDPCKGTLGWGKLPLRIFFDRSRKWFFTW